MIFFDFFLHRTEAPFFKGEMRVDICGHPQTSVQIAGATRSRLLFSRRPMVRAECRAQCEGQPPRRVTRMRQTSANAGQCRRTLDDAAAAQHFGVQKVTSSNLVRPTT